MKKILLLSTIAIFGISNLMNAQNVDFGFKTGLNISNVTGGDIDRNNLFVFHIGGFAEFKISEKFSLQPELLYSRQGSEAKNLVKLKIDYLVIPLMAKYYLSKKFSLEAGPQISFLINDKFDFNDSSIPDAGTDASSFDFGLNLGFGYHINSNLFTQVRYNYGITSISENPEIKSSVFQISLGYKL
ncbi:porin family protein [Winogradskyella sp. UBA3174]|uniref:porin family protein n=1 Tax=Winogradskyella sp. UBA3174 TaxID=1947785 RepID=UPI0025E92BAF|nr:porin family protein [Winogradskyella sp. UBA3174]|tara:strand:- start:3198 stop:3755 length:558 start_codon:yes stop_codon:yes gene_type:complete